MCVCRGGPDGGCGWVGVGRFVPPRHEGVCATAVTQQGIYGQTNIQMRRHRRGHTARDAITNDEINTSSFPICYLRRKQSGSVGVKMYLFHQLTPTLRYARSSARRPAGSLFRLHASGLERMRLHGPWRAGLRALCDICSTGCRSVGQRVRLHSCAMRPVRRQGAAGRASWRCVPPGLGAGGELLPDAAPPVTLASDPIQRPHPATRDVHCGCGPRPAG